MIHLKRGGQTLKVVLDDGAFAPVRAHSADAGIDLRCKEQVRIIPNARVAIDTGVHMQIPEGYFGLMTSKSGLMVKHGITCRGTIDSGYRGSIRAVLFNNGTEDMVFNAGDKVAQIIILPCSLLDIEIVDELDETERGDGGFGSTGI